MDDAGQNHHYQLLVETGLVHEIALQFLLLLQSEILILQFVSFLAFLKYCRRPTLRTFLFHLIQQTQTRSVQNCKVPRSAGRARISVLRTASGSLVSHFAANNKLAYGGPSFNQ